MQASHIALGGSYAVKGYSSRAVVTGTQKTPGGKSYFRVVFPDSKHPDREQVFPSRDIVRVWMQEDQDQFNRQQLIKAELDTLESALTGAGYKPHYVRQIHDAIWIAFEGESANQVVKTLMANPHVRQVKQLGK